MITFFRSTPSNTGQGAGVHAAVLTRGKVPEYTLLSCVSRGQSLAVAARRLARLETLVFGGGHIPQLHQ